MSHSSQPVACDVYPIKNGWKILCGKARIGLASSLGTALSKIARISTDSGVLYRIRIFKEDGTLDTITCSFSPEPDQIRDEIDFRSPGENTETGVSLQERIALLAYSYWEKRGCQGGSPEEDWYCAEREILKQLH